MDRHEVSSRLRKLNPYEFERFLASLWQLQGWETQVTGGSGDKGTDIICRLRFPVEIEMRIQAKRYDENNKVSGPEMQKYGSLAQRDGVDVVTVVTTGSYTQQAVNIANEFNINLMNCEALLDFIEELDAEDLAEEFFSDTEVREHACLNESSEKGLKSTTTQKVDSVHEGSLLTSSGERLEVQVIGTDFKKGWPSGYIESKSHVFERLDYSPADLATKIEGLVIAFEVSNRTGMQIDFRPGHSSSQYGLTIFDSDGFGYEAAEQKSFGDKYGDLSRGWAWSSATVQPQSKSRVVTWVDVDEGQTIERLRYDSSYHFIQEDDYRDYNDDSIEIVVDQGLNQVSRELPDAIDRNIIEW